MYHQNKCLSRPYVSLRRVVAFVRHNRLRNSIKTHVFYWYLFVLWWECTVQGRHILFDTKILDLVCGALQRTWNKKKAFEFWQKLVDCNRIRVFFVLFRVLCFIYLRIYALNLPISTYFRSYNSLKIRFNVSQYLN